jgi:predicted alpha/beta-fold hydrolase
VSGWWSGREGGRALAVFLHGLGGSADAPYLMPLAHEMGDRGWSVLRLNLRGADRQSNDFHHAGFLDDLRALWASPAVAGRDTVVLVGFSLGGHVALRFAAEDRPAPLAAVATISAPLDLEAGAQWLDGGIARWVYRRYLVRAEIDLYREVARRRPVPVPPERAARARTIREFDRLVVAPRFGFSSAEDYYARASVAALLPRLATPSLLLWAEGDPMIPPSTVRPSLHLLPPGARPVFVPGGGHVLFPESLDLGEPGPFGLAPQVASWLGRVRAASEP